MNAARQHLTMLHVPQAASRNSAPGVKTHPKEIRCACSEQIAKFDEAEGKEQLIDGDQNGHLYQSSADAQATLVPQHRFESFIAESVKDGSSATSEERDIAFEPVRRDVASFRDGF